jgi:hypothetical protein
MSEAQLSGAEPVLAPIPISAPVERAFFAGVRRLPAQTQTHLRVAAADDTGELAPCCERLATWRQLSGRNARSPLPHRPGAVTAETRAA